MSYGDIATLPWGTEEFAAGAFGDLTKAELWANRMHQRTQPIATNLETSLRYVDTKDALKTEIDLPPTTSGRDVEMEVKLGLLRGLSIEFQTIADELNYETGHRKVTQARLFGWGVVDRPAYPRSKVNRWEEYLEYAERRAYYGDEPSPRVTLPPVPAPDEPRTRPCSRCRCGTRTHSRPCPAMAGRVMKSLSARISVRPPAIGFSPSLCRTSRA